MNDKQQERILKLLYYVAGVTVASFAFITSKYIDLDYSRYNEILIYSLACLMAILFVLMFFIATIIFKPNLLNEEKTRKLVGFLGFLVGSVIVSVFVWMFLYKKYTL